MESITQFKTQSTMPSTAPSGITRNEGTRTDRLASLSGDIAVAGIGDTDYAVDYQRARDKRVEHDAYGYAAIAFKRAMADAGLARGDIDGLIVGPTLAAERVGEVLGIEPRWSGQADAVNAVMEAALAIHSGMAECVAIVYGNDQRSASKQYGGPTAEGNRYLAYTYYAPWGMTSQGAFYAMMTRRYMELHGVGDRALGEVAVAQRAFARLNDNAIMRETLTIDDYLASRHICEPLRLLDYCLVNDGGVAMILTTAERARHLSKPVVVLAGMARHDMNADATSLRPRLMDFYHSGHSHVASHVFDMSGAGPEDMDLLQIYDSFSAHILFALEGFGYCPLGEAGRFIADGAIGPGGRLPVNSSGGHLSESYMQGWNHQIEAVRQLRHEAGARQTSGARHAQYISDVAGKVASIIYKRGS